MGVTFRQPSEEINPGVLVFAVIIVSNTDVTLIISVHFHLLTEAADAWQASSVTGSRME